MRFYSDEDLEAQGVGFQTLCVASLVLWDSFRVAWSEIALEDSFQEVSLYVSFDVEDHAFAPARLPDQGEAKPIEK